jgi:hypothetical protein
VRSAPIERLARKPQGKRILRPELVARSIIVGEVEERQEMKRLTALSLTGLLTLSAAPDAFAWGAYHGGFGGASYHGAYGGSFSRTGDSRSATGARGSTASAVAGRGAPTVN